MADPSGSHSSVGLSVSRLFLEGLIGADEPLDRYTAGIELSNACRKFYVSRLAAAERAKNRLGLQVTACTSVTSVDSDSERDPPPPPPPPGEVRVRGPGSDTDIGSGNGLVPSGNKPLPELKLNSRVIVANGLDSSPSAEVTRKITSSAKTNKSETNLQKSMDILKTEMVSFMQCCDDCVIKSRYNTVIFPPRC